MGDISVNSSSQGTTSAYELSARDSAEQKALDYAARFIDSPPLFIDSPPWFTPFMSDEEIGNRAIEPYNRIFNPNFSDSYAQKSCLAAADEIGDLTGEVLTTEERKAVCIDPFNENPYAVEQRILD